VAIQSSPFTDKTPSPTPQKNGVAIFLLDITQQSAKSNMLSCLIDDGLLLHIIKNLWNDRDDRV